VNLPEHFVIKFSCPHCSTTISASDEHAGRKGKCPSCKQVTVIPGGPVKAAPPPVPKPTPVEEEPFLAEAIEPAEVAPIDEDRPRRRRREDDEDDDRPRRRPRDDDDYEDDRPRRRRSRFRGEYADCPNCGAPGDAYKVGFTWWGGIVGPAIISCVRCNRCGTNYNGTHGDYNGKRILIYSLVVYGIVFGCCAGVGLINVLGNLKH
jgi:hypothetical protein